MNLERVFSFNHFCFSFVFLAPFAVSIFKPTPIKAMNE